MDLHGAWIAFWHGQAFVEGICLLGKVCFVTGSGVRNDEHGGWMDIAKSLWTVVSCQSPLVARLTI